jgi:hypothetical protein
MQNMTWEIFADGEFMGQLRCLGGFGNWRGKVCGGNLQSILIEVGRLV